MKIDPHDLVHRAHCNQGEYVGTCKYGDDDCPALTQTTGLTCKECGKENCSSLCNDDCYECYSVKQKAWTAKMAIRQDPAQFRLDRLVNCLLTQHWMHECEIVPAYMPPFPGPGTQPTCVVRWKEADGKYTYLRYSKGPKQGYFWDSYGDDFLYPELALLALSQAPPPSRIDYCIQTHGN